MKIVKKELRTIVTPQIQIVAIERVLNGGDISATAALAKKDKKITLMLVLRLNPYETLTMGEAAIVNGISLPTLRERVKATNNLMPKRFNLGK